MLAWPLALALAVAAPPTDLAALSARTRPAVVKLLVEDARGKELGSGTGFFVEAGGKLLTNHHVVEHAVRMEAVLDGGARVPVLGLLADEPQQDLAVLQVAGGPYPVLPLGPEHHLRVGDPVVVIGSPIGLEGTVSSGIVSALRAEGAQVHGERLGSWRIQITAPISHGSSGSPVLTEGGEVIGIAVGTFTGGEPLNFAIPAEMGAALVHHLPAGASPRPLTAPLASRRTLRNLGVSAGLVGGLALLIWWGTRPRYRVRSRTRSRAWDR